MNENVLEEPGAGQHLRCDSFRTHFEAVARGLFDLGYTSSTVRTFRWCLADFDRWAVLRGVAVGDLDDDVIEAFLAERKRQGRLHRSHRPAVRRLLDHLRDQGLVATPERRSGPSPAAELVGRYEEYLRVERGLAPTTLVAYRPTVRCFIDECFYDQPVGPWELGPQDISSFIARHAQSLCPSRAKLMVTALRSFLRFLFQRGQIEADLAQVVLAVAAWPLSTIPKYLSPEDVERLLDACYRSTSIGRRDRAILLLLARLGLRASEVVALRLDEIDWRAGKIVVCGKGLLRDHLPLLPELGEALATYLRKDRPHLPTRRVFVRMRAPLRGFAGPSTISTIVRRAIERAGLNPPIKGAHILRHSLATGMLRCGASMAEVGEVLRHRRPSTTEVYAKVDFAGLRSIAQPWPVAGGGR
jgi:integrase/recombinase XerD